MRRRAPFHLVSLALAAVLALGCAEELTDPGLEEEGDPEIADLVAAGDLTFSGSIPANGWRLHRFAVDGQPDLNVVLDWANPRVNLNLFLYDPSGKVVVYSAGTATQPEDVDHAAAVTGTWTIGIKNKSLTTATTYTAVVSRPVTQPPAPTVAYPGRPAAGTLFWGAGINGNGDPIARHEAPSGQALGLRRTFWRWDQRLTNMVTTARTDLANGRLPWVSTKTPSWADMAAGRHDAEIDGMLRALDALGGPVWLTLHHEPEGGGGTNAPDDPAGPAGHVAMNRRVRERMTALGTHNIALAPILMSWTWTTQSGRDVNLWFAPGIYDFLGVDHYTDTEGTLDNPTWRTIRTWAAAHAVEVAVGEWGKRGIDAAAGARVRAWYDAAAGSATDGRGARVVGLAAFDSNLNSPSGGWELKGEQLTVFRQLLGDARTASVDDL